MYNGGRLLNPDILETNIEDSKTCQSSNSAFRQQIITVAEKIFDRYNVALSDRQVKVVILVHTNKDNKSLHIEQWQMQSKFRPSRAQELDIVSNNGAIHVQPEIPLRIFQGLLFDVKPAHFTGTEVRISSGCLQNFAGQYFGNTQVWPQGV